MNYIKLKSLWSRLVTEVYYRKTFKRLGAGSLVRSPLLIRAKILAGTVLGKQCIVGSSLVVMGEFPDYSVIVRSPARVVKRYNAQNKCWESV